MDSNRTFQFLVIPAKAGTHDNLQFGRAAKPKMTTFK